MRRIVAYACAFLACGALTAGAGVSAHADAATPVADYDVGLPPVISDAQYLATPRTSIWNQPAIVNTDVHADDAGWASATADNPIDPADLADGVRDINTLLTAPGDTAAASKRLPAPKNIIYGDDGYGVNVAWDHIRGIKCMRVWIEKRNYDGPWRWWVAHNDTIYLPYKVFPYQSTKKDQPYDFYVTTLPNCTGKNDARESRSGKVSAYLSVPASEPRKAVNPAHENRTARRAWQKVVTDCNSRAGDVFLVTAGTGVSSTLIFDWVPAVGEATLGAVGLVALGTSGVEYATCLIQNSGGAQIAPRGVPVAV